MVTTGTFTIVAYKNTTTITFYSELQSIENSEQHPQKCTAPQIDEPVLIYHFNSLVPNGSVHSNSIL